MSETVRNPKIDEVVVQGNGKQQNNLYRFLERSNRQLQGNEPYLIPAFTDLADLNTNLPNPIESSMVRVVGQGLAVYNGSNWVKASDDTTLIT